MLPSADYTRRFSVPYASTRCITGAERGCVDAYPALFAGNGKWDGPFGQNAIGPLNVRAAVAQFFTEFGPLREVQAGAVQLSPEIVMADVYQMTEARDMLLWTPNFLLRVRGPRRMRISAQR